VRGAPVRRERRRWARGGPTGRRRPGGATGRAVRRFARAPRACSALRAGARQLPANGCTSLSASTVRRGAPGLPGPPRGHRTEPLRNREAHICLLARERPGPASPFVLFDESSHMPHVEQPEAFLERSRRSCARSTERAARVPSRSLRPEASPEPLRRRRARERARPDPGLVPSAPPAPVTPDSTQRGAAPTPSRAGPAAPARAAPVVRADLDAARPERSSPPCAWSPIGSLTSRPARPTRGRPRCGGGVEE
jgi:hypothetical protein